MLVSRVKLLKVISKAQKSFSSTQDEPLTLLNDSSSEEAV